MADIIEDRYILDFDAGAAVTEINKLIEAYREYDTLGEKASKTSRDIIDANGGLEASSKKLSKILNQEVKTSDAAAEKIRLLTVAKGRAVIGSKQYIDIENEIVKTTRELASETAKADKQVGTFTERLTKSVGGLKGFVSGAAAFGGVAALVGSINAQVSELDSRIQSVRASTQGLNSSGAEALTGDLIGSAETFTGVNLDNQLDSIKALSNEFREDATDVFEALQIGLVRSTTEDARAELLRQTKEYATFFNQAGIDITQSIGLINLGDQLGIYDDKAADAVKETTIRLSDATAQVVKGVTDAFGKTFSDKLFKDIQSGALSTFEAFQLISQEAGKVDLNPQQYQQLVAAFGGGALEDAGRAFFDAIGTADLAATQGVETLNEYQIAQLELLELNREIGRAQTEAASQFAETSRAYDNIRARATLFLTQAATKVLSFFQVLPKFVKENRAAFATFAAAIASLKLQAAVGAFRSLVTSLRAATLAQIRLNLAALANPYVAVTAALLGATAVLLKYNTANDSAARQSRVVSEQTAELTSKYVDERNELNELFKAVKNTNEGSKERAAAIAAVNEKYGEYLPNLLTDISKSEELAAAYSLVNRAILENIVNNAKRKFANELIDKRIEQTKELIRVEREQLSLTEKARDFITAPLSDPRTTVGLIGRYLGVGTNADSVRSTIRGIDEDAKNINDTFSKIFNDILKIADNPGLEGLFNSLGTSTKKFAKDIGGDDSKSLKKSATNAIGSLAALKKTLSELNRELNSQTALTDENAIVDLQKRVRAQIKLIEDAETRLRELNSTRQTTAPLTSLPTLSADPQSTGNGSDRVEAQLKRDILAEEAALAKKLELLARENLAEDVAAKKRVELERLAAIKIAEIRKKLAEAKLASAKTADEIAALKKEIAELDKVIAELDGKNVEIKVKLTRDEIFELLEDSLATIFEVGNAFADITNQQLDGLVDRQSSVLEEMLSNSENFNARQIAIEKDRLNKLETEQRQAAERARDIATIEIAANAALAVAKAATQPFPFNLVAIAGTIGSLVAGLAQIRAAVPSFYEGTLSVQRGNNPRGRDTVLANVNEGEAIIPTGTNKEYARTVAAVYNRSIPASALNAFVDSYRGGSVMPSVVEMVDVGGRYQSDITYQANNMKQSERYLSVIAKELTKSEARQTPLRSPRRKKRAR